MKKIEKEILVLLNSSADIEYGHKFTSLKDTCSDPNPPYTMRITPLFHLYTNYYKIIEEYSLYSEKKWNDVFDEKKIDYLIKNSPLNYLYPAEPLSGGQSE